MSSELGRVQRRQQRTRAQLTRAAAQIIAEKGVEGVRLREVTDAADVGFGSFYNYFGSKEDLVEAVVLDLMSTLAGTLIAHVARFDDPAEAASAAHRWFVRNATEDPATARLMVNLDQADVQFQQRILPFGRRLLESGVEQGRFIPMSSPVTTLTYVVGATIAVTRAVLDGRLGAQAESETAEVLLHALGLDAAQAREIAYRELPSVALLPST
ncbi:MAG TPA: TetR/AcrR family transcriptional regulator [Sporichthyaceae bacterium]